MLKRLQDISSAHELSNVGQSEGVLSVVSGQTVCLTVLVYVTLMVEQQDGAACVKCVTAYSVFLTNQFEGLK